MAGAEALRPLPDGRPAGADGGGEDAVVDLEGERSGVEDYPGDETVA